MAMHKMKREGKIYGSRVNKRMGGMDMGMNMMKPEDKDMIKATMPRMGKAMGGQPSYASGEMPKAMPN